MKLIAWCSALLLLVGIAVGLDDAGGGRERDRGGPASSRPFDLGGAELASASNLRAFDDCVELLDYFREEATSEQLSLGFGYATDDSGGRRLGATDSATATVTDQSGGAATGAPAPVAPAAGSAQREAAPSAEGDGSFSGTNLQEVDVDEPDTVKTDGEVIVAVAGTKLHVIDPAADGPRLLGVVPLPQNGSSELLLTGDRVTVLTRTYGGMIDDTSDAASDVAHDGGAPMTVLTAVDIADPTSPQVVETTTFEGDYVSARMTGTLARIVLRSQPYLGHPEPQVYESGDPGRTPSESAVVTMAEDAGALVQRGRLAGLGTTEQIYAVRYQGDVAYVVTFRQTDPLYTIDLADPAAPRLLGELKIPGFSSYLHPAEDGRLIGVGQDAGEEGVTQGSQVSTFDVSDLSAPAEEDQISFPDSYSAVEYEHRAFLWWAQDRVAVVPLEIYAYDRVTGEQAGEPFAGAVAVDVGTDGSLTERGRVTHQGQVGPEQYASISRSLVIGDTLYTLSEAGILASDLATLETEGWLGL